MVIRREGGDEMHPAIRALESYDSLYTKRCDQIVNNDRSSESFLAILGGSILFLIAYCYIVVKHNEKLENNFEETKKKHSGEITTIMNKLKKCDFVNMYRACVNDMYKLCKTHGLQRVTVDDKYDYEFNDYFISDTKGFNEFLKDRIIREMIKRGYFKSKRVNNFHDGHYPYITLRFNNPPDELFTKTTYGIQVNHKSKILLDLDKTLVPDINDLWENTIPLKGSVSEGFSKFMSWLDSDGYMNEYIIKDTFVFKNINDAKKNHIIITELNLDINFDEIFKLIES